MIKYEQIREHYSCQQSSAISQYRPLRGMTTYTSLFLHSHQLDDEFLSMVHLALQIRRDILSHCKPDGIEISENRAIEHIPNSLYMFINILLGGYRLLEDEQNSDDDDENNDSFRRSRILSIAQDVVYTASGDKIHT